MMLMRIGSTHQVGISGVRQAWDVRDGKRHVASVAGASVACSHPSHGVASTWANADLAAAAHVGLTGDHPLAYWSTDQIAGTGGSPSVNVGLFSPPGGILL